MKRNKKGEEARGRGGARRQRGSHAGGRENRETIGGEKREKKVRRGERGR